MIDNTDGKLKYAQIINKEEYTILNSVSKKKYLIEKNIFIKDTVCKKHTKEEDVETDNFWLYGSFCLDGKEYFFNKEITDEFYSLLYYNIETQLHFSNYLLNKQTIDFKATHLLGKKKLKYLKSTYNYFNKKFMECDSSVIYLNEDNLYGYTTWKDFITYEGSDEIFEYLTNGITGAYYSDDGIVADWIKIVDSYYIKEYCMKLISEIENKDYKLQSSIVKQIDKDLKEFDKEIFPTAEAQQWFNEILFKMSAIDSENKPKRKNFQPTCNAIRKVCEIDSLKGVILKEFITLEDYMRFLEREYLVQFKHYKNLSSPGNREDKVKYLISELIKSNKNNIE